MSILDNMTKQSEGAGYRTELVVSPEWMLPYDQLLVIKMARSGFIYQVVAYKSHTGEYKILK